MPPLGWHGHKSLRVIDIEYEEIKSGEIIGPASSFAEKWGFTRADSLICSQVSDSTVGDIDASDLNSYHEAVNLQIT